MSRTIDGPLDDYEPYSPLDLGPLDGELEQPDDEDSEEQSVREVDYNRSQFGRAGQ